MTTHKKTIIFVAGVIVGIVCSQKINSVAEVAIFGVILATAQAMITFVAKKRECEIKMTCMASYHARHFYFPVMTILFSLGFLLGIVRDQLSEESAAYVCTASCMFEAVVVSSPEIKNEHQVFVVEVTSKKDEHTYDIQIRSALYPKYRVGDTLRLTGKATIPNMVTPHPTTQKDGHGFDYRSYLHTKNIGSEMSYPKIEVLSTEVHTPFLTLARWKENLVLILDTYISTPASRLASGMLFGAASLPDDLLRTFRTVGLSHIVVLSGFNIIIVISSILFVLKFLPLFLRIILASITVIIFVIMVGGGASVVRAVIMAFISLLALLLGRTYVAKQALTLSLLAIMLYDPSSLVYDVSLHLSFLATMGIVYFSEPFSLLIERYAKVTRLSFFSELATTTLSAYFSTLPYVMYTFGSVSVYALIANIFVVPLVAPAMLISFFVIVTSYMSVFVSTLFGVIDSVLIDVMIHIARSTESLPFSTFSVTISFQVMIMLYLIILTLVKYVDVSLRNETTQTEGQENITDIVSY